MIKNFLKDENGQGMVEYALIIGLIALAVIVAITLVGNVISGKFDEIAGEIQGATKA